MTGLCLYYNALLDFASTEELSLHGVEDYLAPHGLIYNTEYIVCYSADSSHFTFMPPSP